ncbi:alpha/beta-hydrolase [Periconia macrospinosa]|uniref:Alpha/beta-hydrolase n=1 Tax=Periconia macrospinosa TaxID=97972 RepID=A0A2V1DDC0_9PLEO|nr:alpha/beta-hydrolase [Periconia macrospinosa]
MTILKAYFTTASGQIHYRFALPSKPSTLPALLFLHKSASSSASMTDLMNHFCSLGYACYGFDMPGFGSSFDPSPSDIRAIEEEGLVWYCKLYISILSSLGLWENTPGVHVLGHHSGAALAQQLAVLGPDIVKSVCLVGPTVVSKQERIVMREKFMVPFNTPEASGAHLMKTWEYLAKMGVVSGSTVSCTGKDLERWHRELLDHVRAWKGRLQIYGAVWNCDSEELFRGIECPVLAVCARDDVLWEHMAHLQEHSKNKSKVELGEVKGANFSVERDVEGLIALWAPFLDRTNAS